MRARKIVLGAVFVAAVVTIALVLVYLLPRANEGAGSVTERAPARMPGVALTDARSTPARRAMLMSLAGSMEWTGGVLVFHVVEPTYATRRDGALAVCADPDPTCLFALDAGSVVRYALTAAVIHRGTLVPGYVVAVRSGAGYAKVERGRCVESAEVASDACLWAIVGEATGGVFDATRALLSGVAPFVPATEAERQPQPAGIPGVGSGTTLVAPGCDAVETGQATCERADRGTCVFCDTLAPAMCEIAALYGACALYQGVCPVQCAISGGRFAGQRLEARAMNARERKATFVARQPMYKASAAHRSELVDPSMSALTTAIRTKRWMYPAMDASVKAETLADADRAYFWAVLRAITNRRMPYEVGSAWSESVQGGWSPRVYALTNKVDGWKSMSWAPSGRSASTVPTNRDAGWASAGADEQARMCKRHLVSSSERAGGTRYLSYARMIGECESAATLREWHQATLAQDAKSPAMTVALGTTLRRFGVGARIARSAGSSVGAARVSAVKSMGVSEANARRVAAFEGGDYAGLTWADVSAMFGLSKAETEILKLALSPLAFTLPTRAVEWTAMSPKQRIALVEKWNAGCAFGFKRGVLQMPQGCGARVGAQSQFDAKFRHGFWPSDLATQEGMTTKGRGTYKCLRCPDDGGGASVVQEESVVCQLKEGYAGNFTFATRYDGNPTKRSGLAGWQQCRGSSHPDWVPGTNYQHTLESNEGDGTYYEDGPDEYFVHYARLDDALTNYADESGVVRRRDNVRVCKPCSDSQGWWTPDGDACSGGTRGVFDVGGKNFVWEPYAAYQSAASPFKRSLLMNTELASVTIAPGFAVYVTPHYHGFHASQRTCHHGLRRMKSEPGVRGSENALLHVEQCRVGSWTPQKLQQPGSFADVPFDAEPLGLVLVNDDLASEWTVTRGDVLAVVTIDVSKKAAVDAPNEHVFPSLVNCLAAWNYCAFPAHWLQRAHTDPASGDLMPEFDVVAGPEANNVGATSAGVADFIRHNEKLGALTVFRTQRLFG
jgi:hypothetical protein